MAVRRTPPVTRNRGSQHGSPSQRGTPPTRGARGRGSTRLGTESAPPHLPPPLNPPPVNPREEQHRSPTLSSSNLHEQSPPFASNEQTLRQVSDDQFTSTPMDHRNPPPHPHLTQTYHPQPRRVHPLSFDDFIGQPAISQPHSDTAKIIARLDKLEKLAPHVDRYTSKVPILKSDGANINTWLNHVNDAIYFMIDKTDYLINPSNPNLSVDPDVDLAENKIAYRALFYTIDEMLQSVVRRDRTGYQAYEAYCIIRDQFKNGGRSSQLALWREMTGTIFDSSNDDLNHHFESIERLADALERDGFVWTRDSVISIICQATMPKSDFDAANVKLDIRWNTDQTPYSTSEVRNALQTVHLNLRRESNQNELSSSLSMMSVSSAREKWPCNYCKQKGHWIENCPKLHNESKRSSSPHNCKQYTKENEKGKSQDTKSVRFSDASQSPKVTALSIEDFANGDGTFSLDREIPFDPPSVMSYRIDPEDIRAAEAAAEARAEETDIPKEYFM
ncbi:hypothetical protein DFH28DRAFT_1093906 [Melampsora americana]|nr:hypothetical protein DFH28DRAFT_1093906 [Melampsora americana]